MRVLLYTTLGCHLCDQALDLLNHAKQAMNDQAMGVEAVEFTIEEVEIANDDALMEKYGIRIPVLRKTTSSDELGWPFSYEVLCEFLDLPL